MPVKIAVIAGTRPEVIKLAPVIKALEKNPKFAVYIIYSGQQSTEFVQPFLDIFKIKLHRKYEYTGSPDLHATAASILNRVGNGLKEVSPDLVIVQGDTTTAIMGAMAAFYQKIPVAHVEAGLRTWDLDNPFPEEFNRVIISKIARFNFAPTAVSKSNLLDEKIAESTIHIVGNSIVDALLFISENKKMFPPSKEINDLVRNSPKIILLTIHRRETWPLLPGILETINNLAMAFHTYSFIFPVHSNPNVSGPIKKILKAENIKLIPPCSYADFIRLMQASELIITDSGGVSEEASVFNKRLLILRNRTERPEALMANGALIGTNRQLLTTTFMSEVNRIETEEIYKKIHKELNLGTFGDGHTGERIEKILDAHFSV